MIKLGVPSKGRLMDKTFDWFRARGVSLSLSGADREYAGAVEGVEGIGVISNQVAGGRVLNRECFLWCEE